MTIIRPASEQDAAGIANLEQMQKMFWQQFADGPKKK